MKLINFFIKKKNDKAEENINLALDHYAEIGNLVREARISRNLTIEELSFLSKIPESTLNSIEKNISNQRPKSPFIRSILLKLEECLILEKNELLGLAKDEKIPIKRIKSDFVIRKFDLINTWKGSVLYFLILLITIFTLNRYFISNTNFIELKTIENNIKKN